jgi:hypothetical protein
MTQIYGLPTHKGLVTPAEGIKPDTWYVAVVSFNKNNPLHACLVYSGLGASGQRWGNYAFAVNPGWDGQLLLGNDNDPYYLSLVRDLGQLPMSVEGGDPTGSLPPSGLVIAGWQARMPGKHWENHDAGNLHDLQAAGMEIRPLYAREEPAPTQGRPRNAAEALDLLTAWAEQEERLARTLRDSEAEPHRNRGANYRLILNLLVPALQERLEDQE